MSRESQIASLQQDLYVYMDRRDKMARLHDLAQTRGWGPKQAGYVGEVEAHLESKIQDTLSALLILDPE